MKLLLFLATISVFDTVVKKYVCKASSRIVEQNVISAVNESEHFHCFRNHLKYFFNSDVNHSGENMQPIYTATPNRT